MMLSVEPNVIKLVAKYTLYQQVWGIYQISCIEEENELDLSGKIEYSDLNVSYRELASSR